jgi:hypothetical protein
MRAWWLGALLPRFQPILHGPHVQWLLLMRAVVGFALGGTPVAVTIFAEFCPSGGRGRWLLAMQLFWTIGEGGQRAEGAVAAAPASRQQGGKKLGRGETPAGMRPLMPTGTVLEVLLAWAVLPTLGWRWLLALSAAPLALLLLLYPLLPESPHWLVSQQRYAEAEAVLRRVAAVNAVKQPLLLQLAPADHAPAPLAASDHHQHAAGSDGDGRVRSRSPTRRTAARAVASHSVQAGLLTQGPGATGGQSAERARRSSPPPQRPPSLLQTVSAAFRVVLGPQLRRTSLLLYAIWNVNAVVYCEWRGRWCCMHGVPSDGVGVRQGG